MPFTQISPGWIVARQNLASQARVPTQGKRISYDRTIFAGGGERLEGASYYWFFTILMIVTFVLFIPFAICYKPKTYLHEEEPKST